MGHDVRGEKEEMYSNCGVLLFNISRIGRYFAGKSGNTMEINLKFEDVNSLARDALAFYDERIFLIDNLHKIDLEDVMRLDFYIAWCCLSGKASLFLGGETRTAYLPDGYAQGYGIVRSKVHGGTGDRVYLTDFLSFGNTAPQTLEFVRAETGDFAFRYRTGDIVEIG